MPVIAYSRDWDVTPKTNHRGVIFRGVFPFQNLTSSYVGDPLLASKPPAVGLEYRGVEKLSVVLGKGRTVTMGRVIEVSTNFMISTVHSTL